MQIVQTVKQQQALSGHCVAAALCAYVRKKTHLEFALGPGVGEGLGTAALRHRQVSSSRWHVNS